MKKYLIFAALLWIAAYSGCSKHQKDKAGRVICTSLGVLTGATAGGCAGAACGAGICAINNGSIDNTGAALLIFGLGALGATGGAISGGYAGEELGKWAQGSSGIQDIRYNPLYHSTQPITIK